MPNRPPGRPRTVIDLGDLCSGQTAAVIAKRAGCSWKTVLRRQHELGIPTRPQGRRDWPLPILPDLPGAPSWMTADAIVPTRRTWS
jgi:hypothetical protein